MMTANGTRCNRGNNRRCGLTGFSFKTGQKGVTLIELVLTVGLMSLITALLFFVYSAGVKTWELGDAQSETVQNARIAMERLISAIRKGRYVEVVSPREIKITMPFGDEITYYLLGDQLIRKRAGGANPVAGKITELKFSRDESGLIQVYLKVENRGTSAVLRSKAKPRGL